MLHKYRRDLVGVLLREQAVVQILLLNPDSDIFLDRRNLEETAPQQSTGRHSQFVSGRIRAEWEASRAVLRDIVNQLVTQHSKDIKELSARLQIKKHRYEPKYSFLFVDTSDEEQFVIYNEYQQAAQAPDTSGGSSLVYPGDARYLSVSTGVKGDQFRRFESTHPAPSARRR